MKKLVEVRLPKLPNNISVGGIFIPIEQFTDDELEEVGNEWRNALVALGKEKRK